MSKELDNVFKNVLIGILVFAILYMSIVGLFLYKVTNLEDRLDPAYYKVVITNCNDKSDTIVIYDNKIPCNKHIQSYKNGIPYYYTENDKLFNICNIKLISSFKTEIIMGDTMKIWVNN